MDSDADTCLVPVLAATVTAPFKVLPHGVPKESPNVNAVSNLFPIPFVLVIITIKIGWKIIKSTLLSGQRHARAGARLSSF